MTVIAVPGMFNSASFSPIVSIACLIHSQWKANVVVVDLRGHGHTGRRFQDVPFSLTVLEAHDLLEVAKFARTTFETESVFLLGISLGGASVLSAAVQGSDCSNLITACATVSAPMDLDNLLVTMSQGSLNIVGSYMLPPLSEDWLANFHSFVQHVVQPYYANEFAQLLKSTDGRISPMPRLQGLQVPLLAIHSRDDPVATLDEPQQLKRHSRAQKKEHWFRSKSPKQEDTLESFQVSVAISIVSSSNPPPAEAPS